MKDYVDNIAIDPEIYSKWPESINDWCLVYVPETLEHAANLIFIKGSDEYPAQQIHELVDFPDTEFFGRIMWRVQGKDAPVVGLVINPEYRNLGIAKFLCIIARTWVAQRFNSKIFAPASFRTSEVEEILKQIAVEYNEEELVVQTKSGEYKPFGEILDPETELGVQ